jgi:ATPase subunit of ABC transporter with duplicated ATPase domains
MSHRLIFCHNVGLSFPQKVCFEGLTAQIHPGDRIAIIGQNGSGKTTLLNMLRGLTEPTQGNILYSDDICFGTVPQVIESFDSLSGGQRFNKALTQALSTNPEVLLLDEPTNHLDQRNRQSLMRMLQNYVGTLIVVSHDDELLRTCVNTLWHIEDAQAHIFSGNYDDYRRETLIKRSTLEQELAQLDRQRKEVHDALMKEQKRAKKSRSQGEKSIDHNKWPTMVSHAKARRAAQTTGRKKRAIRNNKEDLLEKLSHLRLPEILTPKFSLQASDISLRTLVSVQDGSIRYEAPILTDIAFSLRSHERMAILGDNGSGKTTLIKAIFGDPQVTKTGTWTIPKREEVGYLDQHYGTLDPRKTVLETIQDLVPAFSHAEVRNHLNDFLFRKNEEVNALVSTLSGGEKARLSLAQIAAKTPKLLILDEITNNLDLETREHVIQVLNAYPGAIIVISHDADFLRAISIENFYVINALEDK